MFNAIKRMFHDQSQEIAKLQQDKEALLKRVATLENGNLTQVEMVKSLERSNNAYKAANSRLSNSVAKWKAEYHTLHEELQLQPDESIDESMTDTSIVDFDEAVS